MGGSAFEYFGLYTPRIPPDVYKHVLERAMTDLSDLFLHVECAIEAPEKKDYGDLDILVVPRPDIPNPTMTKIAGRLHADKWFSPSGSNIHHFAIPWPEENSLIESHADELTSQSSVETLTTNPQNSTPDRHIQIDLTILPDDISLRWALFSSAHGDLVNIIASIIIYKGLTINNHALYLRIPSLEAENRKLARVELSRDPEQVLRFLGLNIDRFWKSFDTLNDLLEYVATSRFHNPQRSTKERASAHADTDTVVESTVKPTKGHYSRPAFKVWFETFLPAHVDDPPGAQAQLTREEVLELTFDFFGGDTRQRYLLQKQEGDTIIAKARLWSDIRKQILQKQQNIPDNEMEEIIKALKREITARPNSILREYASIDASDLQKHDDSGNDTNDQTPIGGSYASVHDAYLNNDFDTVITWAAENYITILERYRRRVKESGGPGMLDHRKANPFSQRELETYSTDDDEVIRLMKKNAKTWGEILTVLGKKSRSQLTAHWKNDLNVSEEDT